MGDQQTKLMGMSKHSWGHTALVDLQRNAPPFHTFIWVFAQRMRPNLLTVERGAASCDESDSVHNRSLANSSIVKLEESLEACQGYLQISLWVACLSDRLFLTIWSPQTSGECDELFSFYWEIRNDHFNSPKYWCSGIMLLPPDYYKLSAEALFGGLKFCFF